MYTLGHHNFVCRRGSQGIMKIVSIKIGHINVYPGSSNQCVSKVQNV